MKHRTVNAIVAALGMLVALLVGVTAPAHASETASQIPSCKDVNPDNTASGTCADITREATSSSSTTDKSVAAVGTNGKILTRYVVAAGIKLKSSEKSSRCKLVKKASQIPAGATCIRGARGFHYVNSGLNTAGKLIRWSDYVGSPGSSTPNAKWMKFVKRGKQWLKAGDQTGAGNCANPVRFKSPKPKLTWKQVINIRSFAQWKFEGKVAAKANSSAEAYSVSWCEVEGSKARATATSGGSSSASSSASYVLKGLTQIRQWTNAKEAELHQSLKLQVDAEATAKAKTKASAEASTKVECSGTTPPPTQPPTVTPPTFMQFRQINDVYVNATTDHCVTVDFPEGHSGTVFWTATYGSFATATKSAQDTVQVCSTYKAPSEVPSSGTDTITVTATDSVTGKSVVKTTDPFVIKAMPATP